MSEGILFVISAPSGTGKSTVARRILEKLPALEFSVSYTTRPRRDGEIEGRDYHFVDGANFRAMVRDGEFLEWAEVFGRFYGTGLRRTREGLAAGKNLLLDIDVQGARQVRGSGLPSVAVMLLPPDYQTLEARLTGRGSESGEQRIRRLAQARREVQDYGLFDYLVVNRDVDRAVEEVESIIRAEFRRRSRNEDQAQAILATFPANG